MFFDDSFDQMFDNAFKNFWGNNELATFDAFKTDVIDQGDSYLLQAELPGFDKSDINIDLKDSLPSPLPTRRRRTKRTRASISAGSVTTARIPEVSA